MVIFELPAGGKPCTLKFRGNGFVKKELSTVINRIINSEVINRL